MAHWCEFCQMEHSSASCFHPGRPRTQDTFRVPDVFTPDNNPRVAYGYLAKAYRELEAQCAAMREYIYQSVLPALPGCQCHLCIEGRRFLESNDAGEKMLAEVKRLRTLAEAVRHQFANAETAYGLNQDVIIALEWNTLDVGEVTPRWTHGVDHDLVEGVET